jgi:hypothetical protein
MVPGEIMEIPPRRRARLPLHERGKEKNKIKGKKKNQSTNG